MQTKQVQTDEQEARQAVERLKRESRRSLSAAEAMDRAMIAKGMTARQRADAFRDDEGAPGKPSKKERKRAKVNALLAKMPSYYDIEEESFDHPDTGEPGWTQRQIFMDRYGVEEGAAIYEETLAELQRLHPEDWESEDWAS
ncbi:MAG: hypothetical protein M3024_14325 [Candidatus Dormibacteraeota bacterium]|nr:hypothetical protein [Candidatus Dormibacteraeota bacterium]